MEDKSIEINKTFALFMGMDFKEGVFNKWYLNGVEVGPDTDLHFNDSYEWLMPVVIKIESMGYYLQSTRTKEVHYAEFRIGEAAHVTVHSKGSAEETELNAKFLSIRRACLDFIDKYNK